MRLSPASLVTLILLLQVQAAPAQVERTESQDPFRAVAGNQQQLPARWHYGCELFQMLLEESAGEITQDPEVCLAEPASSVVVIVGEIKSYSLVRRLAQFARGGGGILLATDSHLRLAGFCNVNGRLLNTRRSSQQVQGFSDVLRIRDLDQRHPLLKGVSELILNKSSWIELIDTGLGASTSAVAVPRTVLPRESWDRSIISTVSVHGVPNDHVIIAADHSLFTNGMLWHADNALLAINACKLLMQGSRKNLLFSIDGMHMPSYREQLSQLPEDLPNMTPDVTPELSAEQMLQVLNRTVAKAEDADLINALIADRPRRLPTRYYRRGLLFALAAGIVMMALVLLLSRSPIRTQPRQARAMQAAVLPGSGDIDIQHPDGVRRAEAARVIAAEFMTRLTRSTAPERWQEYLSNFHRQHEIGGGSQECLAPDGPFRLLTPDPVFLRAQLDQVMQAATSLDTKPISRQTLLKLSHTIDQLSRFADDPRGMRATM